MIRPSVKLVAIAVLLCGCRSAGAGTDARPAQPPKFYCEYSYTNFDAHHGIYVDPQGTVFYYQHRPEDHGLRMVRTDISTEAALLLRFAPGRVPVDTVAPAEMALRYRQVLAARAGRQSRERVHTVHMGINVQRCYVPNEYGVWVEVRLRQRGDDENENTSRAAARLSTWMDSLAVRISRRP